MATTLGQLMEVRPTPTTALVGLDVEHVELADQVAEYDRAAVEHHSHPSTRNARSL